MIVLFIKKIGRCNWMEDLFPQHLLDILAISVTFSFILMSLIQKFKTLSCINKSWHVWVLNFISSFLLGIPFSKTFYGTSFCDSIWVGIFSFIGAASIYSALKNQTILTYKPSSISDTIKIPQENEIERTDLKEES